MQGGEHGEHGERGAKAKKKQGGEGGEGGEEGGAKGGAALPPDLDFALRIAQMRGHLLVGDELVKQGQWAAALPHFLHPSEELYGPIRGKLKDYNTPQFATALKLLATTVKQKKGGDDYAKAWKGVEDALAAADAGVKAKQAGDGFAGRDRARIAEERDRRIPAGARQGAHRQAGRVPGFARLRVAGREDGRERRRPRWRRRTPTRSSTCATALPS